MIRSCMKKDIVKGWMSGMRGDAGDTRAGVVGETIEKLQEAL
jgi:hypothetical protein